MLHGAPGKVVFRDGDSHSADWLSAGFDTAIGARKVNANLRITT
jgi:hypothetical protein